MGPSGECGRKFQTQWQWWSRTGFPSDVGRTGHVVGNQQALTQASTPPHSSMAEPPGVEVTSEPQPHHL